MSAPRDEVSYVKTLEDHIEFLEAQLIGNATKLEGLSKEFDVNRCIQRFVSKFGEYAKLNQKEKIVDECIALLSNLDLDKYKLSGGDFGKSSRIKINENFEIDFNDTCFSVRIRDPNYMSEVISVSEVSMHKYKNLLEMVQVIGRCIKNKKHDEFIKLLENLEL
jgi:hypothetical protein